MQVLLLVAQEVIYNEGNKNVSINVKNPDKMPYLIQSWIDDFEEKKQSKFTITPPLFRLNPDKENTLRIFLTEEGLPSDQESLFWLNIKTIPATEKTENSLQIAFKTQMKLIYRPKSLKDVNFEEEQKKLSWSKERGKVIVYNPTPYFMNFQTIKFNGKLVDDVSYAKPFSTKSFDINDNNEHGLISWELINDYGANVDLSEVRI